MWLDDQEPFDALADDWLAARELLGLSYDGDVTKVYSVCMYVHSIWCLSALYSSADTRETRKEPETPRRPSKTMKKIVTAFEETAASGNWG